MPNHIAILLAAGLASAATPQSPQASVGAPRQTAAPTCSTHPAPTENLAAQLAKFRPVQMPFSTRGLSAREVQMVRKLVEAGEDLESIFWRQSDPEGLALYQALANCPGANEKNIHHYLLINGSRYDLLEGNKPFLANTRYEPGHALYPAGITRKEIEDYVAAHPVKKAEIYHPWTVVRRSGRDLVGVPYHVAFRQWLVPAAKALRDAASLSDDKAFANFLRLRADALLTDDYYKSDLAWVDLDNHKFDVIMAPYETYLDDLLGVKTSYGVAVMIRNPEESAKLTMYKQYAAAIQDALPIPAADRPSNAGHPTPMEVMDTPYRSGDLRHGYQAVADNLPNDPRIHQEKGTKKIFFKNFMDARVNYVILPVAQKVMRSDQAVKASAEGYLLGTILHEMAHGLGPAFARTASGTISIREAIGPTFSGLEEAKADAVGMFGLKWMVDHGVLPKEKMEEYYASYIAGIFRTVRFGTGEAHGKAEMMEFNYLSERGAIKRETSGRYAIDYEAMPGAVSDLAKELLEIEATGDRDRAEKWFARYDKMPDALKTSLKAASDVPVDIDPVFSFKEPVR
jgi:hypothetical protein